MVSRRLSAAPRWLTVIALVAAGLAVVVPSGALARRSDLLLALLVFVTALGIPWSELLGLREHMRAVLVLSVMPLIVLAGVAWVLSRAFTGEVRDGLLATGLSSSEVASVGLVALAGADATIALGAVTGSLIAAAVLGPVAVGWLGGGSASSSALLGRFALVVLVPLVVGVALRSSDVVARYADTRDEEREGVSALTVAVLVYAALSGAQSGGHLGSAALASAAFLGVSAVLGLAWLRGVGTGGGGSRPGTGSGATGAPGATGIRGATGAPGAFAIGMRDFAVAAALATQAFGAGAGTVPGIYGVFMLVAGSAVASTMRRR